MSNYKNLIFFNKEGDSLNFKYSEGNDRFEGDILFHENSTDTFKTYGLYMLEKVNSIQFELPGILSNKKFQLFNEYGIHFYQGNYINQQITNIEPVNNDPNFSSKWIYGDKFEKKFPIGTFISFDSEFLEFTNLQKAYVVVGSKKNAIMIIGQIDNNFFEITYKNVYLNENSYIDKKISGLNLIGIYDYINFNDYTDNLSTWNEPTFYSNLFNGKKLNVVNSQFNDGVYTIKNKNIYDVNHFEYQVNSSELPENKDFIIEIITKTDLPKIYEGEIIVNSDSTIEIETYPSILKPGTQFKISGTSLNDIFLTVDSIINWNTIYNTTYFEEKSQILYNNKIYECILSYTQSFTSDSTSYINPEDETYWSPNPSYVKVIESTIDENINLGQLYLTTDTYYFLQEAKDNPISTLASFVEKYKEDIKFFNIEIYYNDDLNELKCDLIYPTKYAIVNYYFDNVEQSNLIGNSLIKLEKLIEVNENVKQELNYDISENYNYNIVFNDLDEYGFKIVINGMIYEEETNWAYIDSFIDMKKTIDRTLRKWLSRNYVELYRLGIIAELEYIGNYSSIFFNSINLKSQYPNIPFIINDILIGTGGDFHIEHSEILFNNIGPYLNININDVNYGTTSSYISNTDLVDIPETLERWVNLYSSTLNNFDIIVKNINNLLKINYKDVNRRLDYSIQTNILQIPGIDGYVIKNKMNGNLGCLIASNEVVLPGIGISPNTILYTQSQILTDFYKEGFGTGMIMSINNTDWPLMNREYNITFMDEGCLNLSYEGPFWGSNEKICDSSAFTLISFDQGFSSSVCNDTNEFSISINNNIEEGLNFNIEYNPNDYTIDTINLNSKTENIKDIKLIQLSNLIYVLGDDLLYFDSFNKEYLGKVELEGTNQNIKIEFNNINNYIYCLSNTMVYVVDPLLNNLIGTFSIYGNPYDLKINTINGDVYVTYNDEAKFDIWTYNNFGNPSLTVDSTHDNWSNITNCGKMAFDELNQNMCILTNGDNIIKHNINNGIKTHEILNLDWTFIYIEPIQNSIIVYNNSNILRVYEDGDIDTIDITSKPNSAELNTFNNYIYISDVSNNLSILNPNTNDITSEDILDYGHISISKYDGDVYISGNNSINVYSTMQNTLIYTEPISTPTTKIIFNDHSNSIFTIQPQDNNLIEISTKLNSVLNIIKGDGEKLSNDLYGTLDPNYVEKEDIWLSTRDHVRTPKENYSDDVPVKYYWKWGSAAENFFLYDFSGEQLPTTGSFSYKGPKPLTQVVLNKKANRDISKVYSPEFQQTIFDVIEHNIPYIDSSIDNDPNIEPIQLFIGFKSVYEGAFLSILQLYKREEILFSIQSDEYTNFSLEMGEGLAYIKIDYLSNESFTNKGLKEGQLIVIYVKDTTNEDNKYISYNDSSIFKINSIFNKELILDLVKETDFMVNENSVINDYPKTGDKTYLNLTIKVADKEIGRFNVYGQSEEEDERFKIELGNVGKLINPDEVFIFKDYDILEGGIDWKILNVKRKEMLMMKHLIYPYIGSYKSIINAINYFGYNDLKLNEYYRNINQESSNFLKLFKVEIPDIFDNSVEGWTETDFIKNTYPNENYEETNMFNLTYFITDKEGNNLLNYSIDEIIIKLQGLKYWLKKNIIPLTHKILDITGESYKKGKTDIHHKLQDIRIFKLRENMTPISFKLNDSYLMPINSGSTVYTCLIDFYTIIPEKGSDYSINKPKPSNLYELNMPDYFEVNIKTYKTYKEWNPFKIYNKGDKVKYYDRVYESTIDYNRTKNPRRYESVSNWESNTTYQTATIVKYNRDYYTYTNTINNEVTINVVDVDNSIPPNIDTTNWLKITEWKEIDLKPVQTIKEFRKGDNLNPFSFTVDSNIDPFIAIEVKSDNGYGQIYNDRKNYELRGLNDLGFMSVYEAGYLPKITTDLVVIPENPIDINFLVTDELYLHLDASDSNSYPGTGQYWYNLIEDPYYSVISGDPIVYQNSALLFNGINNSMVSTFDLILRYSASQFLTFEIPKFTFSMWIKRTGDIENKSIWKLGTGNYVDVNDGVMSSFTSQANKIGWSLINLNRQPSIVIKEYNTGKDYPLNEWVNVTWVKTGTGFNKNTLKVYINGVEYALINTINEEIEDSIRLDPFGFIIAAHNNNDYSQFETSMVLFYHKELSKYEIVQNYLFTKSKFGY